MTTPLTTGLKEDQPDKHSESSSSDEEENMEYLRRFLAEKLNFSDTKENKEKIKVLDNVTLDGIVDYIKANDCKNIITLAGAGISTSAGIPDFRSPGTGLYDNLQKYNLPHPQAIFEIDFFSKNPKPFFELAKELYPGTFKPTICHYFIKLLDEKGKLLRHYTQNIDTLERVAGVSGDKIIEAHGTFHTGHCLKCKKEYSQDWMKEIIFRDEIPMCKKCNSIVKPDIIFFGESLPEKFHKALKNDFNNCDLLIIIGTSLAVQPFASLVDRVENNVPRLLINRDKVGQRSGIAALLGMSGGLDFDSKDNTRDVCWLGDCDEGCLKLAEALGWAEELKEKVRKEHDKIDGKNIEQSPGTSPKL
ncbi:NAD-dependent protein deacetylase sirtuin-2 [Diorhabda sublineata]|uniref:NAD-dependent protein deacetylase sirtuin-2 n=1 Tax=Diorhabda sublineata TaxID=1163346 RepID=UPI0024E050ED|nr:NAD-dependent protein deacetylase sirtuin-2 [Diorhabda sublineata]